MKQASVVSKSGCAPAAEQHKVTAFVCANCARAGVAPFSVRPRPSHPDFKWPFVADEILVPCAGRLQPEHLLKAFESGASFVCIIACEDDNCHYSEGCRRARNRLDYVRGLLAEIGLGGDRLSMFQLPGSAREDMDLGEGRPETPHVSPDELARRIQAIRDEVTAKVKSLSPNPLHNHQEAEPIEVSPVEQTDDNED